MEPMRPSTVRPAGSSRARTERPWALAASRLTQFGENVLVGQGRKPAWRLLAEQFASTVVVVLLVAAVVAAALGDLKDTVVILAILVLNSLLGFVQEYRAEQAMAELSRLDEETLGRAGDRRRRGRTGVRWWR
jgi:magnesium-transporting ATPase (P-type)